MRCPFCLEVMLIIVNYQTILYKSKKYLIKVIRLFFHYQTKIIVGHSFRGTSDNRYITGLSGQNAVFGFSNSTKKRHAIIFSRT